MGEANPILTVKIEPEGRVDEQALRNWQIRFVFDLAEKLESLVLLYDDWIQTRSSDYREVISYFREVVEFSARSSRSEVWYCIPSAEIARRILEFPLQPCDYLFALVKKRHRDRLTADDTAFSEERDPVATASTTPKHIDLRIRIAGTSSWKNWNELHCSIDKAIFSSPPPFRCSLSVNGKVVINHDRA